MNIQSLAQNMFGGKTSLPVELKNSTDAKAVAKKALITAVKKPEHIMSLGSALKFNKNFKRPAPYVLGNGGVVTPKNPEMYRDEIARFLDGNEEYDLFVIVPLDENTEVESQYKAQVSNADEFFTTLAANVKSYASLNAGKTKSMRWDAVANKHVIDADELYDETFDRYVLAGLYISGDSGLNSQSVIELIAATASLDGHIKNSRYTVTPHSDHFAFAVIFAHSYNGYNQATLMEAAPTAGGHFVEVEGIRADATLGVRPLKADELTNFYKMSKQFMDN